jgi:signal peptidase I
MNPVSENVDGGTPEEENILNTETIQKQPPAYQKRKNGSDRSLLAYTLAALGIALVIRFFIAAPYVVIGSSMEPNFHDYNYLIIDQISYSLSAPHRGDVIVLDLPGDTGRALIKRIIGLPNETVILSGPSVIIKNAQHPDGFTLSEPYLDPNDLGGVSNTSVTLGPDQYFVLGDNRKVSADSRLWGLLPRKDIVGRVLLRLYPLSEIAVLPAQGRYDQ